MERKQIQKKLVFVYVDSEREYPVYRCANDGDFYFLTPCFARYCFKELVLRQLYEKYEKLWEDKISRQEIQ